MVLSLAILIFSLQILKSITFLNTVENKQRHHFHKSTFKDLSEYEQCYGGFGLVCLGLGGFLPQICSLPEMLCRVVLCTACSRELSGTQRLFTGHSSDFSVIVINSIECFSRERTHDKWGRHLYFSPKGWTHSSNSNNNNSNNNNNK